MPSFSVERHGPLFDGRAQRAAKDACQDMERTIAETGAMLVRANLNAVLRHQTPYYRLRVQAQKDPLGWRVTDGGVIYGPWLEGTGSRNRTTRFKGYFTFRRTAQEMRSKSTVIANGVLRRYLSRME